MVISPVGKLLIGVGLAGTGIIGTSLMLTKTKSEEEIKLQKLEEKCEKYKDEGNEQGSYASCMTESNSAST